MEETKKSKRGLVILIAVIAAVLIAAVVVVIILVTGGQKGYGSISVSEIVGDVTIENNGDVYKAYPDMHLTDGFAMMTARESYSRMSLDDEKFIKLEEESRAKFEAIGSGGKSTYINLEYGSISNEITRPLREGEEYMVTTPNAVLTVRGTLFVTKTRRDTDGKWVSEVYTFGGSVATRRVLPDGTKVDETVYVNEGYKAIIKMDDDTTYYIEEVDVNVGDNVDPIKIGDVETDVLVAVYDAAVNGHDVCFGTEEMKKELADRGVDLSKYKSYRTGKPLEEETEATTSEPGTEESGENTGYGPPPDNTRRPLSSDTTSGPEDTDDTTTASTVETEDTTVPPEDDNVDSDDTTVPPEPESEETSAPEITTVPDETGEPESAGTSDTTTVPEEETPEESTTTTREYIFPDDVRTSSSTSTTTTTTEPSPSPEDCEHEKHKLSSISHVYTSGSTGHFSAVYVCSVCGGDKQYVPLTAENPTYNDANKTYTYIVHVAEVLEDEMTYTDKEIKVSATGISYECSHPENYIEAVTLEEANCRNGKKIQKYCSLCENYLDSPAYTGNPDPNNHVGYHEDSVTAVRDGMGSVYGLKVHIICEGCGDEHDEEVSAGNPSKTVWADSDHLMVKNTYNYSFTYNGSTISGSTEVNESGSLYTDADMTETCPVCGENFKNSEYVKTVATEATCSTAGSVDYKCPHCGERIKGETIPATGRHSYSPNLSDYEETWTHIDGTYYYSCNVTTLCAICGQRLDYTSGTGTASSAGQYEYTYDRSNGIPRTVTFSCPHDGGTHSEDDDPTCVQTGLRRTVCDLCGATVSTTTIPATGEHDYVASVDAAGGPTEPHSIYECTFVAEIRCRNSAECGEVYEYTLQNSDITTYVSRTPVSDGVYEYVYNYSFTYLGKTFTGTLPPRNIWE